MSLIIFTDLDGTLLNQEDYDYKPALPMLKKLKRRFIPVVPVTSKTRKEVEELRQKLGLSDPFIVENGSAIFLSKSDRRFLISNKQEEGDYYLQLLGRTYAEARQGLKEISAELDIELRGFGDLSEAEIEQLTGLSLESVRLAKTREFTEPFVTPSGIPSEKLEMTAKGKGFKVLVGDRFSHLVGSEAGKGKAVEWLIEQYHSREKIVTVGLGNSPNDLQMLKTVDIPIIIPGKKEPHPGLVGRGWEVAPSPGSQGWNEAIEEILVRF